MEKSIVIGVDVGGTHITAAQVHIGSRQLVSGTEVRQHVHPLGTPDAVITEWSQCIINAAGNRPLEQVCIAMPGPFDYDKGICLIEDPNKYPALHGLNVKQLLAEKLNIPVQHLFLHNDAACFLQGEIFGGCMTGHHPVIGITLGTGFGSAHCRNGISQDAGWWAYPFLDGIAEEYLSTRWFIQRWQQTTGESISGVKELAGRVGEDARAKDLFQEFAGNLATVLTAFIQKESPQAVVIGGNIANAYPLFKEQLLQQVHKVFPAVIIEVSQLGEKAALIGAAGSWHAVNHNVLPY